MNALDGSLIDQTSISNPLKCQNGEEKKKNIQLHCVHEELDSVVRHGRRSIPTPELCHWNGAVKRPGTTSRRRCAAGPPARPGGVSPRVIALTTGVCGAPAQSESPGTTAG